NSHNLKLPKPEKPRKITIGNQTGGVSETTCTVNLAWALGLHGLKLLVIDQEPQGSASTTLDAEHRMGTPSRYEPLIGDMSAAKEMQQTPVNDNVYTIPATIDLAGFEIELVSMVRREYRLVDAINDDFLAEQGFDFVFIDCPPSL